MIFKNYKVLIDNRLNPIGDKFIRGHKAKSQSPHYKVVAIFFIVGIKDTRLFDCLVECYGHLLRPVRRINTHSGARRKDYSKRQAYDDVINRFLLSLH